MPMPIAYNTSIPYLKIIENINWEMLNSPQGSKDNQFMKTSECVEILNEIRFCCSEQTRGGL